MKTFRFWIPTIVILLIITCPYLLATLSGNGHYVFGGFLLNPLDGNTYLSKMYQGMQGSWQFKLTYSANAHDQAYLFLFYLFLGHLARWTGLSLIVVFHLARIFSSFFLISALWFFFHQQIDDSRVADYAFLLSIFGAGLGWAAVAIGQLTTDMWVAEAYPFLSMYANPHFPLAMGLMLLAFGEYSHLTLHQQLILFAMLGLLLAVILPFGSVIVMLIIGLRSLLMWIYSKELSWRQIVPFAVGSLPVMIYQLLIIRNLSDFREWNIQNLTPAPLVWDFIISFSPALFIGLIGWIDSSKKPVQQYKSITIWAIAGIMLLYLPIGLQRRFILGLFIPVAGLAAVGLEKISRGVFKNFRRLSMVVLLLSVPTNLLNLSAGMLVGINQHDPAIYLTIAEYNALDWISQHTALEAVILASPNMGQWIPARTGRRVVYGHPIETIRAEIEKQNAELFFMDKMTAQEIANFIKDDHVTYVFYGPREKQLGNLPKIPGLTQVYADGDVQVYSISNGL